MPDALTQEMKVSQDSGRQAEPTRVERTGVGHNDRLTAGAIGHASAALDELTQEMFEDSR